MKEKEEALFICRRDVECQRNLNGQNRRGNEDLLAEKDALERHAQVLQAQNDDLTTELDRFVQTDEILRTQLDRRSRVHGLTHKNQDELRHSTYRVQEARSRSPKKSVQQTPSTRY